MQHIHITFFTSALYRQTNIALPTPITAPVTRFHYVSFLVTPVSILKVFSSFFISVYFSRLSGLPTRFTPTFPVVIHIGITKTHYFHLFAVTRENGKLLLPIGCFLWFVAFNCVRVFFFLDESKIDSGIKSTSVYLLL